MKRLLEIDIFRGLLLVIIVINHTPNPLKYLTSQPFGFVSAAEAFVFISAFLCGLVYSRKLKTHDLPELHRLARRRALQIYTGHLLSLLFCFSVIGQLGHLTPFYNIIHLYLAQPSVAMLSALLLLYQPPLLDILPMYLIFLLLTPWVLDIATRRGWQPLVIASLLLWLAAQFGLKAWITSLLSRGLVVHMGAFNLFAWQAIWLGGLFLGHHFAQSSAQRIPSTTPKWVHLTLIGLTLFFFCWRWEWLPISINWGDYGWLLDKWQLGPVRLLNFLALLYLALLLAPQFSKVLNWLKPLALVGRNTLPLFCLHVCFSLLAVGVIELYELSNFWCYSILSLQLLLIVVSALLLERIAAGKPPDRSVTLPPLHD